LKQTEISALKNAACLKDNHAAPHKRGVKNNLSGLLRLYYAA